MTLAMYICAKNYESLLAERKVIAAISMLTFLAHPVQGEKYQYIINLLQYSVNKKSYNPMQSFTSKHCRVESNDISLR